MNFEGLVFEDFEGRGSRRLWELRIPLTDARNVNFFRDLENEANPIVLSAFAVAVQHGMKTCMERRLHQEAPAGSNTEIVRIPAIVKRYYASSLAAVGAGNRTGS
jgi:hypothetical protein